VLRTTGMSLVEQLLHDAPVGKKAPEEERTSGGRTLVTSPPRR
jgi:hypothetical protein